MTEVLGYSNHLAQGGDWGSHVAGWLGHDHAHACSAINLNMIAPRNPGIPAPGSEAERPWGAKSQSIFNVEGAYLLIQATKPQSLAFAMMDSPVGIAAWIVEKFGAWSDLPRGDNGAPILGLRFSDDQLLTNVMIYLVSRSFATSMWSIEASSLRSERKSTLRHVSKCRPVLPLSRTPYLVRRPAAWSSVHTISSTGPTCRAAAISRRWKSPSCLSPISGRSPELPRARDHKEQHVVIRTASIFVDAPTATIRGLSLGSRLLRNVNSTFGGIDAP